MSESTAAPAEPRFNPVPSLITLCNAFCGFASILYAIISYAHGESTPHACIWLLLAAMIFDTLDGLAARFLHAKSTHGAHLDSLADAISFGVAPAVAIFIFLSRCAGETPTGHLLTWCAALFFLACALWRLARYNTLTIAGHRESDCFRGLPSPAAACMIYSTGLVMPKLALGPHLIFFFAVGYAFLTGLLMISDVPYPHVRRCVSGKPRVLSVVFIGVVLGSIAIFRVTALVIWAYIYFLIAPLTELLVRNNGAKSFQQLLFAPLNERGLFRRRG